jgi:uncharacterized protein YkwD
MATVAFSPAPSGLADPVAPAAASSSQSSDSALLVEINAVRTDPHAYATALRADIAYFHDLVFEAPGQESLETIEGAAALKDAIADLESRAPAPPLAADSAIARAALRLVADQGRTGALGHVDSANATLRDRLESAGVWAMSMEEDIAYGPSDPREVIRELIIDDGVPDRAHRKAIFDTTMTRVGYACGPHATWGWMCVIDFTSGPIPARRPISAAVHDGGVSSRADAGNGAPTASAP